MKFSQPPMIRFYVKYVSLILCVALPVWLLCFYTYSWITEAWQLNVSVIALAVFFAILAGFMLFAEFVLVWEKHWGTLHVTEDAFIWKCPFRRKRVIQISKCAEIGVYTENKDNGIPKDKIYFSDYVYPQKNMNKQGEMKPSEHLIIFWYSDQLADYLTETFPGQLTSKVLAYKIRSKRK